MPSRNFSLWPLRLIGKPHPCVCRSYRSIATVTAYFAAAAIYSHLSTAAADEKKAEPISNHVLPALNDRDQVSLSPEEILGQATLELSNGKLRPQEKKAILFRRASAYRAMANDTKAATDLREILEIDTSDLSAKLFLADCLWHNRDEAMFGLIDDILGSHPDNPSANMLKTMASLTRDDVDQAFKYAKTALRKGESNSDALYAMACVHRQQYEVAASIDCFTKAIMHHHGCGFQLKTLPTLHLGRAEAYLYLGDYDKAMADAMYASKLASDGGTRSRAYALLWRYYFLLGEYQVCDIILRNKFAKTSGEEDVFTIHIRASTDLAIGRINEARRGLDKLLARAGGDIRVKVWALSLLVAMGDHAQASSSLATANLATIKSLDSVLECKAYLCSCSDMPNLRDGRVALQSAQLLCDRTNNLNPRYLMLKAFALSENDDFEAAIKTVQQAIELTPKNSTNREQYQKIILRMKDRLPARHDKSIAPWVICF